MKMCVFVCMTLLFGGLWVYLSRWLHAATSRKEVPCEGVQEKEPQNAEELFNRHHSRLRNVIERSFGAAKMKWQMLDRVPHYPLLKQSQLIMAGLALRNFVHQLEGPTHPPRRRVGAGLGQLSQIASIALSPDAPTQEVREWITLGLGLLGNKYVKLVY